MMQIENTTLPSRREMVVMRKRPLGETGIDVPWVGLSTRALAYAANESLMDSVINSVTRGVVPDADAIHLIRNAMDMQSNLIEASPAWGKSERLLGAAVHERRSHASIVTMVGSNGNFEKEAMEDSLSESFQRLQTNYVDVLLLDNPPVEVLNAKHKAWSWLKKLKAEGKIRAYGASVAASDLRRAAEQTPSTVLQTRFSIFQQEAAEAFDVIKEKRIGLIAAGPLDSGFLGGRYGRMSLFFDARRRWSRSDVWKRGELRNRVEALRPATVSLSQFALQFVLWHPAVSCALASAKDPHQLIYNVDTPGGEISEESIQGLKRLWLDEIQNARLSV